MYLEKLDNAKKALAEAETLGDIKKLESAFNGTEQAIKACKQYVDDTGEMQNTAAEMKIRAQRKGGRLISTLETTPGKRSDLTSSAHGTGSTKKEELKKVGMKTGTADRWEKIASIPEKTFERHITETKEKNEELTSSGMLTLTKRPHVSHNSGENEWYTPKKYIESARKVLGTIDLDPASSEKANEIVKAGGYHSMESDGLSKDWYGKVWMNPPYSSNLIGLFIEKFVQHFNNLDIYEGIVLVNNATETAWFQFMANRASCICFPKTRIKYWSPNKETSTPLQGQAFLYFGNHLKFKTEFIKYGFCCEL